MVPPECRSMGLCAVVEVLEMPGREWFPPCVARWARAVEVLEMPGRGGAPVCRSEAITMTRSLAGWLTFVGWPGHHRSPNLALDDRVLVLTAAPR